MRPRLRVTPEQGALLDSYPALCGRVEGGFCGLRARVSLKLKRPFLPAVWPDRQRVSCLPDRKLDGKIALVGEKRLQLIEEAIERIWQREKVIRKPQQKMPGSNGLQQKSAGWPSS
ncbi:hypothetical protein [Candidatus Methylacidithermus pantelleriae]|uniref:Uncharacterized protein n=1 Tax=Candidatus Methylacidithermus pantelleriae TaxID=2744239 RepID=A0A8J2BPE6_9BACT|nr:hypothetical protein [Candidatus Methylacidithermus pantelleriae]CAF0704291.1 hypothetical protein MPNT_630006 [Candidatus Methylacidithermus pantelleriae]